MRAPRFETAFAGLTLAAVVFLAGAQFSAPRPLIREIAIESVRDMDGWLLVYRYAVNGQESTVILKDDKELEEYRDYLREFGDLKRRGE